MYFGKPWNVYWHRTRLFHILDMLKIVRFRSFLDVGCAEGYYLKLMASVQVSEEHSIGLDIAKNYLIKAKKKVRSGSWVLADAHNLPFKEDSFDLVLCSEVFEHLLDPKKAFMEITRVSKKYVLLSVAGENLFYFFAKKLGLVRPEDPLARICRGHIHEMRISEIVSYWASEAGCKHVKSIVTCYFPASFLGKHRAPSFLVPVVKSADKIIEKLSVVRELGSVQIALLEKPV